ncbi:MAG: sialidase family protein [Candidatus Alcyoniella australis]|nr:sialidase family protein [Candidatus Alcyoniella australis]
MRLLPLLLLLITLLALPCCVDQADDPVDDDQHDPPEGEDDAGQSDDEPFEIVFVDNGVPLAVRINGEPWLKGSGYLEGSGRYNFLHGDHGLNQGDFTISVTLSGTNLQRSSASIVINGNSRFILSDLLDRAVLQGPMFNADRVELPPLNLDWNQAITVELVRSDIELLIRVQQQTVYLMNFPGELGTIGLCPSKATLRVHDFRAYGYLYPLSAEPYQTDIFIAGDDGYGTFRIPAITRTLDGTLLAFCEGRVDNLGDSGNIDLVLKRSVDQGISWSALIVVCDFGADTCGNPAPIVDRDTGRIWLPFTTNDGQINEGQINRGIGSREVWITHSDDDGLSWAAPSLISAQVKLPDWRWYATGPCHGVQLENGTLVVPCDHTTGTGADRTFSHVILSDDHGASWRIGGTVPGGRTNESTVVQLDDGSLLLNMRSRRGLNRRAAAISTDNGLSWGEPYDNYWLVEPICQGSILDLDRPATGRLLLFSNPASTEREAMTVRLSLDQGAAWPIAKWLHLGPSAYSDLVGLNNGDFGLLYERGEDLPYDKISFAGLSLDWLTDSRFDF